MGDTKEGGLVPKLLAAAYYMVSSMVVQLMNKALFTTYGFQCPLLVGLLQMAFIAPICYAVAKPRLELETLRAVAPLAAVSVLNLVCGLIGTGCLNVPMFIALRRFTLLATIVLERVLYHRSQDRSTYGAVAVMITGALIAAITDLSFNLFGYSAVLANDVMTALYLVMVKHTPTASTLTTTGLLFYNAAMSIPLLGVAVAVSSEPATIRSFPMLHDRGFQAVLAATAALGLTINHSTFLCTRVNEPLMTSVAGSLKNGIMTVVGAMAFPDFLYSLPNAVGLGLSMLGAIWYATHSALKGATSRRTTPLLPQNQPLIGRERLLGRAQPPAAGAQQPPGQMSSTQKSSAGSTYRRVASQESLHSDSGIAATSIADGGGNRKSQPAAALEVQMERLPGVHVDDSPRTL